MKVIKILIIALSVLGLCVGCSQRNDDDSFRSYIKKNFGYTSMKEVRYLVPPILGGKFNYYVTFTDKSNNDCFIITDLGMNKYILIYDNSIIETNKDKISSKYKELIDRRLNPQIIGNEYTVKTTLTDAKIKKAKSNIDKFKNGEIGELHFTTKYVYKDEKKGNLMGPTESHSIVLFDTETNKSYEFDESNKQ